MVAIPAMSSSGDMITTSTRKIAVIAHQPPPPRRPALRRAVRAALLARAPANGAAISPPPAGSSGVPGYLCRSRQSLPAKADSLNQPRLPIGQPRHRDHIVGPIGLDDHLGH